MKSEKRKEKKKIKDRRTQYCKAKHIRDSSPLNRLRLRLRTDRAKKRDSSD